MDRNLGLEFVRVTEAGAIAAARWIGRGDKLAADGAAVDEMRSRFNQIDFQGTIVIGEGDKDEAPELYTGEKVGTGSGPEFDIAVDPLEATNSVAYGRTNALSVIVTGAKGSLLSAPDTHMDKIAVGPQGKGACSFDKSVAENLEALAKALGKPVSEIMVIALDREHQKPLVEQIRAAGARISFITDGDVAAAIATCMPDSGIDILLGVGGSTEAVLAAAAVKIMGGEMLCRFEPLNERDHAVLDKANMNDPKKVYTLEDLAAGQQLSFTATGVIEGPLLPGVVFSHSTITTHSVVMRAQSGTVRYITTHHKIDN